jgi:hypothetical protein
LEDAIKHINDITPGVKAVVGVRSALIPVTNFGAFWGSTTHLGANVTGSQKAIDEVLSTGWLGTYMGAPLIAVDQVYNNYEDYTALLPANKVLVIGQNVGEFVLYGNPVPKEWTDMEPTPPYWHFDVYQQMGLIIDFAQGIYVIQTA